MNPTRPVTYRLLKFLLAHAREPFTQLALHRRTGASLGQVNKVIRWLSERAVVERRPLAAGGREAGRGDEDAAPGDRRGRSGWALVDPGGVLDLFAMARRIQEAERLNLSGDSGELAGLIGEAGGVACLETALASYSDYFRPGGLYFYHPRPGKLAAELAPLAGGRQPVALYQPDLPLAGDVEGGRTDRVRTVIDLACASRLHAAEGLLRELWGLELG